MLKTASSNSWSATGVPRRTGAQVTSSQFEARALLRKALNDPSARFREGQWEAIDGVANHRKRRLVVQATGWGKSYIYFIATRILRDRGNGPTLIISPLLDLMRNQIAAAESLGVKAVTLNSSNKTKWAKIEHELEANM